MLADKKIQIEEKEETGKTPLLTAVISSDKNENLNILKSLLLEGADWSSIDIYDKTAIDYANELKDEQLA